MQTINQVSKQTNIQTNKHTNKQASSEKHVHMPMARGVGITKKKRDSLSFWLKAENITNLRTALRPDSPIYCHAEANVRMQVQPFWIEVLVLPTIQTTIVTTILRRRAARFHSQVAALATGIVAVTAIQKNEHLSQSGHQGARGAEEGEI